MCSLCLRIPCDRRCPNAIEPKPVMICSVCNEGIFEGNRFYDSNKGPVCEACLEDMTVLEILKLFGEKLTTAEMM